MLKAFQYLGLWLFIGLLVPSLQREAPLPNSKIGSDDPLPASSSTSEEFFEELFVNPLSSGHVNTYFQFTTRWHYSDRSNLHNTQLIPRPIAEILLLYNIKELHISLTQGHWRYESWGYPVVDSGLGAEVWGWFAGQNLTEAAVDQQWTHLASTFSGILCSSLNFIDQTNSIKPKYGFRPQFGAGKSRHTEPEPKFVRYATVPREIVCTENLTPWKKLLPCNSHNGFASLLNSGHVHNTNYHSLAIKVRTICAKPNEDCVLEFTETANLVYDIKLLGGGSNDFSLRRLFGQGLNGHCALAKTSKVYVNMADDSYELTPPPKTTVTTRRGGSSMPLGVYDIQLLTPQEILFNVAWVQRQEKKGVTISPPPPIFAHRYILGRGQERGQIITQVVNTHYDALPVILQENIPWYVPTYMHSLKLVATDANGRQTVVEPKAMHYVPGVQRQRAYHLEVAFEVPASSSVQISLNFDYIFLKWLEYPPDANHGHYLGAAVLTTQLPVARNYTAVPVEGYLFADSFNASRPSYHLRIRTESLLLSLPTPDFSMPYNVICLACTVVALAFGPIHSVATKRIVVEAPGAPPQSLLRKLLGKLKRKPKVKSDGSKEEKEGVEEASKPEANRTQDKTE